MVCLDDGTLCDAMSDGIRAGEKSGSGQQTEPAPHLRQDHDLVPASSRRAEATETPDLVPASDQEERRRSVAPLAGCSSRPASEEPGEPRRHASVGRVLNQAKNGENQMNEASYTTTFTVDQSPAEA